MEGACCCLQVDHTASSCQPSLAPCFLYDGQLLDLEPTCSSTRSLSLRTSTTSSSRSMKPSIVAEMPAASASSWNRCLTCENGRRLLRPRHRVKTGNRCQQYKVNHEVATNSPAPAARPQCRHHVAPGTCAARLMSDNRPAACRLGDHAQFNLPALGCSILHRW